MRTENGFVRRLSTLVSDMFAVNLGLGLVLWLLVVPMYNPVLGRESSVERSIISYYDSSVYPDSPRRKWCTTLLGRSLVDERYVRHPIGVRLRIADELMRANDCLDTYSKLQQVEYSEPPRSSPSLSTRNASSSENGIHVSGAFIVVRIHLLRDMEAFVQRAAAFGKSYGHVRTVLLDLRGNGGGEMDSTAYVLSSLFAPKAGVEFLRFAKRSGTEVYVAPERGALANKRYIILTDRDTASGAEAVVGTIRYDWYPGGARIVGERTYGKSEMQCTHVPLRGPTLRIKLTCGKWFAGGRDVSGRGITPDVTVDLSHCGFDYACVRRELTHWNVLFL